MYHVGKQLDRHGDNVIVYARENGMKIVGYSSLSAYPFALKPLEDPIVKYIASTNGYSTAQVILRWMMQHGD